MTVAWWVAAGTNAGASAPFNDHALVPLASAPPLTVPTALQGTWRTYFDAPLVGGAWQLRATGSKLELHAPSDGMDDTFHDAGAVSVSAGQVTFGPSPECPTLSNGDRGTYTWTVSGKGLLDFAVVSDPCTDRVTILTTADWIAN